MSLAYYKPVTLTSLLLLAFLALAHTEAQSQETDWHELYIHSVLAGLTSVDINVTVDDEDIVEATIIERLVELSIRRNRIRVDSPQRHGDLTLPCICMEINTLEVPDDSYVYTIDLTLLQRVTLTSGISIVVPTLVLERSQRLDIGLSSHARLYPGAQPVWCTATIVLAAHRQMPWYLDHASLHRGIE